MNIQQFVRLPFYVDAVQVTQDNMAEVAEWCSGRIQQADLRSGPVDYIKVAVPHTVSERQTMAFVGDWVLKAGKTFKVYTQKAFDGSFEAIDEPRCNNANMTADGKPCVFVIGHRDGENPTGCRSYADYKNLRPVVYTQ